jgi:hypothetical protein
VAEELGQARLVLTLDDGPLREGLQVAKLLIEKELGGAVGSATRRGTTGGRAGGGRTGRQAAESINSEIAANRTLRQLRSSLNKLEAEGVDTVQLRVRFFQIEKQVKDSLFGSARRNSELLKQQITDEKLKLDLQRQQLKILNDAASAGRGTGPSSSIRGSRLLAGSPANLEFLAGQGGPTSPIRGGAGFPGSPIAIEKARAAELRRTAAITKTGQALLKAEASEKRLAATRSKDGRATGALSNAIIGGAFPLLFGQGIGAAAGGATGGAAGGLLGGQFGFGLSLVGTAVGTAFDTALQKGQDLARGLKDPIGNFDLLKQNALLSSKAVESQAEALIAAGREAEAYALIQRDLTSSYGDIAALEEYRVAVDELNREWTRVSIEAARFAAAPLTEFLERLRLIISGTPRTREEAQGKRETAADLSKAGLGIATAGGALSLTGVGVPLGLLGVGIGALLVAIGDSLAKDASKQVAEGLKQSDITTFWDTILKAGARSVVAGVVGFRDLETAANLQQTRTELGNIPGLGRNFRFLEFAEQEQKVAALLASLEPEKRAETLQKINKLREQEFKLVSDLQRLDTERSNALVNTERSLANSLQLLGTQRGAYRDTLGVVQGITDSIIEAQQVRDLATQDVRTAALALDPNAPGADLARLQERQRTINTEFANVLAKGAFELQKASETARDNFRDAVLNLTKIRSDPGGLNRFLTPGRQRLRAEQDTAALLPLFRQAQQQFAELTGQRAPEFRGPRTGVNDAIRDFIEVVKTEREANLAVQNAKAAADLIKTNQDLLEANRQLAIATIELAQKQWLVDVNVVNQAGGASTVNAVTSLAS